MKLNAEQYIELSNIGTSNIFVENDNRLKLSWEGVTKIIKAYDKMNWLNDAAISKNIAKWDKELEKSFTFDFSQISNEEIENAAAGFIGIGSSHITAFIEGAKWYREQLNKK